MKRASQWFSEQDKRQIDQAVRDAEARTTAEIVPAVATASGRYDRPEDIVGIWLGGLAMVAAWFFLPASSDGAGSWEGGWPLWASALVLLVVLVAGFILGAILGANVSWLRRLFTSRREMRDDVTTRAAEVFATSGVYRTVGATGLLIYVSLFERLAVVQADQAVVEKLGQETLDGLRDTLVAELRAGNPAEAFCKTIRAAGDRLETVLPKTVNNPDELPNELRIID